MDVELIGRMLAGDSQATLAVRNHLRTVATRVLTAPQWGISEGAELNRAEQDAAAEAVAHRPATPVTLAVAAMASASRIALEKLRQREGHGGTDHPDARLLVALALQTASAAQANNLKPHLERCAHCRRHMELIQHAVKSAASATEAAEHVRPTPAAKSSSAADRAQQSMEDAMAAAMAAEEGAARTHARPRPRPPKNEPKGSLTGLVPLALVLAALGFFSWRSNQLSPEEASWLVGSLLPPEIPPTSRAEQYAGMAREGLLAMRDGDCREAGNRLKSAVKHDPDDVYLRYYEGLALVCQRKGPEALEALTEVQMRADTPPFGLDWWLGQAQLLSGDIESGLSTLDVLAAKQHPRADQARDLAYAVREQL